MDKPPPKTKEELLRELIKKRRAEKHLAIKVNLEDL
jgi:hypothetical protein